MFVRVRACVCMCVCVGGGAGGGRLRAVMCRFGARLCLQCCTGACSQQRLPTQVTTCVRGSTRHTNVMVMSLGLQAVSLPGRASGWSPPPHHGLCSPSEVLVSAEEREQWLDLGPVMNRSPLTVAGAPVWARVRPRAVDARCRSWCAASAPAQNVLRHGPELAAGGALLGCPSTCARCSGAHVAPPRALSCPPRAVGRALPRGWLDHARGAVPAAPRGGRGGSGRRGADGVQ